MGTFSAKNLLPTRHIDYGHLRMQLSGIRLAVHFCLDFVAYGWLSVCIGEGKMT